MPFLMILYARTLAGEHAELLVGHTPGTQNVGYAGSVRTYMFDTFITCVIQEQQVDTVLNLAAGLDTRPYRLNFPATLRWIEVDLPDILAYKQEKLATEEPACILERVALDLTQEQQRQELFSRINKNSQSVLIITEGLLNYLTEQQMRALTTELASYEHFHWWCTDLISPLALSIIKFVWKRVLHSENIAIQYSPADDEQFFHDCGWQIEERSDPQLAYKLRREISLDKLFRLLSYLPGKKIRRTFRTGSNLLLKKPFLDATISAKIHLNLE